jgi:flagellar motility protein MotE (MotC chaperone)
MPTATYPIWLALLIVIVPAIIANIPSVLSAIYVRRATREKQPTEEKVADGVYVKDISTGYKDLNKTCQEMLEIVYGQVEHLQEVQKVSNDTIKALQDTNKIIQTTLDRVLEESERQEQLIRQLLNGVDTLIRQLKDLDPNIEPKFNPQHAGF